VAGAVEAAVVVAVGAVEAAVVVMAVVPVTMKMPCMAVDFLLEAAGVWVLANHSRQDKLLSIEIPVNRLR
jgi:hypothetical protein